MRYPFVRRPSKVCKLLLCALFSATDGFIIADDAADSLLVTIAESYKANKAAFSSGSCRFTFRYAGAQDEEKALRGSWLKNIRTVSSDIEWCFRDNEHVFKMVINNDELVRNIADNKPMVLPLNVVIKGEYALDHDPIVNNAIIHSPEDYSLNVRYSPFNLAEDSEFSNPAALLASAAADRYKSWKCVVEEDVEYRGGLFTKLTITADPKINSYIIVMYLDPSRGFLPIITEHFQNPSGEFRARMVVSDVLQAKEAFFPLHACRMIPAVTPEKQEYLEIREMKVIDIDLKQRPDDTDMIVSLPKDTQFKNGSNSKTAQTIFRNAKDDFVAFSVDDLETTHQLLQGVAIERDKLDTIYSRPIRSKSTPSSALTFRTFAVILNVCFIVSIIGVLVVKSRKYWLRPNR